MEQGPSTRVYFHPMMLAVEGNDGVGKTTFYDLLHRKLATEYGVQVMPVKEPATQFAHDAAARLNHGPLAGIFPAEQYDLVLHSLILQDITAYRARMHFANGVWVEDQTAGPRMVLNDRTWWTTVSYQYGALGVPVAQAMADHLMALSAPHRCNGIVHLPGVVFYITDGEGGKLCRERSEARGDLDPVYEQVHGDVVEEREKRYQALSGLVEGEVFTIVNDHDSLEEWQTYANKKIDQILQRHFKLEKTEYKEEV